MRANGNQFEDKCIFIKYVKSFDLLCFIFHPANFAFSSNISFANPSWTQIPHQLPVYSHSIVWIQDTLKFHLFLLYSHLKIYVLHQLITGYFFFYCCFIFCMVIPKKGIFYWHTSTSCVIDCSNNHVHDPIGQCIDDVSYPRMLVNTNCFSVKEKNNRLY